MPLPKPSSRKLLHSRDIQLRGYEREDGLVDVEAHLTDTKSYSFSNRDRGNIPAGEPIHEMWLRITIDHGMTIIAVEAAMDATPHNPCSGIAPNYQRLVGLNMAKGFMKAAMQQLGGVEGCTHLRELLQPLGTIAFQTMSMYKRATRPPGRLALEPALINTCHAYNENGPLVQEYRAQEAAG